MGTDGDFSALVVGDGAMGTAVAMLLAERGRRVALWSAFPAYAEVLRRTRRNPKFLPGVTIPDAVAVFAGDELPAGVEVVVLAVPVQHLREVLGW